jgi:hypothetical protein
MTGGAAPDREVVLETGRLLLRPWRVAEALVDRVAGVRAASPGLVSGVLDRGSVGGSGLARSSGYEQVWATVWEWNTASRRVLAKVGFTETERKEVDAVYGTTLFTTKRL